MYWASLDPSPVLLEFLARTISRALNWGLRDCKQFKYWCEICQHLFGKYHCTFYIRKEHSKPEYFGMRRPGTLVPLQIEQSPSASSVGKWSNEMWTGMMSRLIRAAEGSVNCDLSKLWIDGRRTVAPVAIFLTTCWHV